MRRHLAILFMLFLVIPAIVAAQDSNPDNMTKSMAPKPAPAKKKSGPIFRATKDQVVEAQKVLKERRLYSGEQTGKLDDATRKALKEYQKAESLKVTGTLNKLTLEKMSIPLTDKQKMM